MIEADRADHSRAKLDHDLIVPITTSVPSSWHYPHLPVPPRRLGTLILGSYKAKDVFRQKE